MITTVKKLLTLELLTLHREGLGRIKPHLHLFPDTLRQTLREVDRLLDEASALVRAEAKT